MGQLALVPEAAVGAGTLHRSEAHPMKTGGHRRDDRPANQILTGIRNTDSALSHLSERLQRHPAPVAVLDHELLVLGVLPRYPGGGITSRGSIRPRVRMDWARS